MYHIKGKRLKDHSKLNVSVSKLTINIYAEQKEFVYSSVKKNLKNKTGAMNPGKPRNDRL